MDKLDKTLHILLSESSVYDNMPLPNNQHDKRNLLRALLNIRPPRPISREFLAAQDAELQLQLAEKGVVTVSQTEPCGCDERVRLWQGDITRLQVDAIVNAANDALLGCFVPLHKCIDNAIHSAAGIELRLCDTYRRACLRWCSFPKAGKAVIGLLSFLSRNSDSSCSGKYGVLLYFHGRVRFPAAACSRDSCCYGFRLFEYNKVHNH